jgi:hypothetical protein
MASWRCREMNESSAAYSAKRCPGQVYEQEKANTKERRKFLENNETAINSNNRLQTRPDDLLVFPEV